MTQPRLTRRGLLQSGTAAAALSMSAAPAFATNPFLKGQWPNTDFDRASVPMEEIFSGGVPRDGIPALDTVSFGPGRGIEPNEPVLTVSLEGEAERAYPIRYLMWHEIANDRIGATPIAVTYCPLCNSALVFDRRAAGRTFTFGVSGMLRHSDMVMYDRETESWWQQFTGEAIVGAMTGTRLTQLVSWLEPLSAFAARNPGGPVMQRPVGFRRDYGTNPYVGYDGSPSPFLYRGENPPHGIPPLARVVRVGDRAWPLSRLQEASAVEEAGVRIEWQAGMASALDDRRIAKGRDVGSIRVFDSAGRSIPHEVVFAFAFHAFEPEGVWMLGR